LLPFVRSGNARNPVQNLHAARRATRLAAAGFPADITDSVR
jgi:hypothetical protein